jgi:hypothetical protein
VPDYECGRFRAEDRWLVLATVEDALGAADAPQKNPLGSVSVIVRVTPPFTDAEKLSAERARGCATKV